MPDADVAQLIVCSVEDLEDELLRLSPRFRRSIRRGEVRRPGAAPARQHVYRCSLRLDEVEGTGGSFGTMSEGLRGIIDGLRSNRTRFADVELSFRTDGLDPGSSVHLSVQVLEALQSAGISVGLLA